jgi:putative phosphoesterase
VGKHEGEIPEALQRWLRNGRTPKKLGLIADIHGNADGLRWALTEMDDVDLIFCAGDAVYQYAFSNEVFDLMRKRDVVAIQGNHEAVILSEDGVRLRESGAIVAENMTYMEKMPIKLEAQINGRKLLMVHGSPWNPLSEYIFPHSTRFNEFHTIDADIVVLGHTHFPMVKKAGKTLVVNPGSCGDARENDAYGRAWSLATLDLETGEVDLRFRRLDTIIDEASSMNLGIP